jgi:hypothetical protein
VTPQRIEKMLNAEAVNAEAIATVISNIGAFDNETLEMVASMFNMTLEQLLAKAEEKA